MNDSCTICVVNTFPDCATTPQVRFFSMESKQLLFGVFAAMEFMKIKSGIIPCFYESTVNIREYSFFIFMTIKLIGLQLFLGTETCSTEGPK